jgi:Cytochrome c oxidase caa3 assembly factor (Caa3_CtaG)
MPASANRTRAKTARSVQGARPWPAVVAVLLALSAVLPPAATYARQYAFVQALQFSVFAVLTPGLLTLGTPRRYAASRRLNGEPARRALPPARAAAWRLVPFMALVIIWRLPVVLDALARYPVLAAAELVTLVGAGLGVWLAIAGLTPATPLPRPLRAAMAAIAMWTIWIIAYVTGMSSLPLIPRSAPAVEILGSAMDRQLATAVLWAAPAACLAPVVYYMLMTWLSERDARDDKQADPSELGTGPARRPAAGAIAALADPLPCPRMLAAACAGSSFWLQARRKPGQ